MMPYTAAMKDARLELRIDRKLMERIDEARGDVSRTRWVERALESALGDVAPASQGAEGGGRLPSSPAPSRAPEASPDYGLRSGRNARLAAEEASKLPAGVQKGAKNLRTPSVAETWRR
jgi:hypothetical protein